MNLKLANNKGFNAGIHLLIWGVLFTFPYIFSVGSASEKGRMNEMNWIRLCDYVVIFYANYFFLIDKYLFGKKIPVFILSNIFILSLVVIVNWKLKSVFLQPRIAPPGMMVPEGMVPLRMPPQPPLKLFLFRDIISQFIPVVFAIATKITMQWAKVESEKKETEKEKLMTELQQLKYQLHPHFFFNSLNTIYSLIDLSPQSAKETVHSLAKMMRYMLYDTENRKVSLAKEIDFMKQYIDLMKKRINDNTSVSAVFPEIEKDIEVAPLLFIPLIENAFKHGISAKNNSNISFEMKLNNHKVTFKSENDVHVKVNNNEIESGIGLINLEKRLSLLYPGKFSFFHHEEDNLFRAELNIDFD
jgi:two-component sensor histidine kinase